MVCAPANHAHRLIRFAATPGCWWPCGLRRWRSFLGASVYQEQRATRELGLGRAQIAFEKDVVYRRWMAQQHGVYVWVTDRMQPSEYLRDLPQRDIVTPSGTLTLINPARACRHVYEIEACDFWRTKPHHEPAADPAGECSRSLGTDGLGGVCPRRGAGVDVRPDRRCCLRAADAAPGHRARLPSMSRRTGLPFGRYPGRYQHLGAPGAAAVPHAAAHRRQCGRP